MSARSLFTVGPPVAFEIDTATANRLPLSYIPENGTVEPTAEARVGLESSGTFSFVERGAAGRFPDVEYSVVAIATQTGGQHVTITVPGASSNVDLTGGTAALDAVLPAYLQLPAGEWVVGTVSYTQAATLIGYVSVNGANICIHPIAGNFNAGALTFSGFTLTYTVSA